MTPWLCRTASPEAGRVEALERALRGRYPGARVDVSGAVVRVSVSRDGLGEIEARVRGESLAAALDDAERMVRGLVAL